MCVDPTAQRGVSELMVRRVRLAMLSTPGSAGTAGTKINLSGSGGTFTVGDYVDSVMNSTSGVATNAFDAVTVSNGGSVAVVQTRPLTMSEQSAAYIVVGRESNP